MQRGAWFVVLAAFACAGGSVRAQESPLPPVVGLPVDSPPVAPPEPPPAEPPKPRKDDLGGFGGIGGFGAGGGSGGPGYNAAWYPSRPVSGQGTDLGLVRQNLSLGVPLWREDGELLALTGGIRNTLFSTNAVLPDSGRAFPETLWNVNLGLAYSHKFANGWSAGGFVSLGSASDKPFDSFKELTGNVTAFLRIPVRNERDAWLLGASYSPVGNLNFPVPVVAYVWNPSEQLRVNIGLPFSVSWRPTEDLTFSFSYIPIVNVNARVAYQLAERVSVFGGFEWLNEAYLLADRVNNADRFRAFEKRLVSGVRWDVGRHGTLELNGGYAFDRYYGIGQNSVGNLSDRVDVAPGAFLGASFRLRF